MKSSTSKSSNPMTQPNQSELPSLDEAIQKFAAYARHEGDFDELDLKEVIYSEVAERERAARVKELERIIRGYHSVDHLMDEQELKERIATLKLVYNSK